jgi:HSP20 family protein
MTSNPEKEATMAATMTKDAPAKDQATGDGQKGPTPAMKQPEVAPAVPGSPFTFMRRFAEEMDRLFEDFGMGAGWHVPKFLTRGHELLRRETGMIPAEWSPRIDVHRADGKIVVKADLPGLKKDDIHVEVTPEALTIRGERKQEKAEERKGSCYRECSYGSFYRSIPMPEGVDTGKAVASFQNGVLEITLPAPTLVEEKPRRVEIAEKK